MDENHREQVALFRYGLIAPILQGSVHDRATYIAEAAGRVHQVPGYGAVEYSPRTIELWHRRYIEGGFDSLKPGRRSDRGESRVISKELEQNLIGLRQQHRDVSQMKQNPIDAEAVRIAAAEVCL